MRERIPLCLGVFVVMALSNAIVPILPLLGEGTIAQGAIYSAYFLGAFLFVLPSGILSDRIGEVPVIIAGLLLTTITGVLLLAFTSSIAVFAIRLVEGFGAGLFVPAALSLLNTRPDHEKMSGYFMAMLNIGLMTGLVGTGWLVGITGTQAAGLTIFTALSAIPLILSFFMPKKGMPAGEKEVENIPEIMERLFRVIRNYLWLWVATVIIIGTTGAVTAIYPEFTDLSPQIIGIQIAAMNISTAVAVFLVSRANLPPIPTIRVSSILMAAAVILTFFTPWGFILIGALAGVVIIATLAFLASAEARQGVVMGLFNTASYGGMTLLPFLAGLVAEKIAFFAAFAVIACFSFLVAGTIGACRCSLTKSIQKDT
ncbi:MAG TPA: MFS transporter [Methanoregulaceae archaeon]|nr:MFS transporter [Methanoregulaceae archaeon]